MAFISIAAVIAGIMLHDVLMRTEFDEHPISILVVTISPIFILAKSFQMTESEPNFQFALLAASRAALLTITSTLISTFIYRVFFHKLNNFPGPFGAKISKFWALGKVIQSRVRWYQVAEELHEKYGDYVRTGPRELSISDPQAILPILGPAANLRKGPFYGSLERSLHCHRDAAFHKSQRKIWDIAFKESLNDYGSSIEEFTSEFLKRIEASEGKEVYINELCLHYSYDVMSLLAFGESARFLEGACTEQSSKVLKDVHDSGLAVGALVHVPWILTVVESISFAGPIWNFNSWSAEQVEKRKKAKVSRPDIMGHLIEHTPDTVEGKKLLYSESRLIIFAGSDTTSGALTVILIFLALYPLYQDLLQEEVDASISSGTYSCGTPQPILDSIINEVLRLYNPTIFSPQRVTGPKGLKIGDVYIPPDTIVCLNRYQLHRDPRNFVNPSSFIPERWTSRPELILNRAAYTPFSLGKYNCPGKSVAMMEVRSVIARTVRKYRIGFPEKVQFDEKAFFGEIKEQFTIGVPKCELVFEAREGL